MISLERITFTYPGAGDPVLREISVACDEGELVLVAGASGTGKSTLLRVPNGLVPHYTGGRLSGRVVAAGRDVTGLPPREMAGVVGFVPQDPEAHTTAERVTAELCFAMENLSVPPPRMRLRLEAVLDQLGIAGLRDRRLSTLSGGERQRVAVAAVLCAQPSVVVCDEPTSALDPQSAEDVLGALVRLRDELGLTVIVSEHRLERVAGACDRVVFMGPDGSSAGSPREVFETSPFAPPVCELGRRMGWNPLPLTVREARRFAAAASPPPERQAAPDGEPLLEADGVKVRIGSTTVLDDATLTLQRGIVTALVGRNGSGKTTLVRTLAGLVKAQSGRIKRHGPLASLDARDLSRRVAYVPQRAEALLFRDSVGAELRASAESDESAAAWAARLSLSSSLRIHPWELSAGQRLRLALGTALARHPDVYLLDEPTRGMDPPSKQELAGLLRAEAERGAAVLLVTHDVELVARVADRVALMSEGQVVAHGEPRDVLAESLLFSSQTAKVMGDSRFMVPEDVRAPSGALV